MHHLHPTIRSAAIATLIVLAPLGAGAATPARDLEPLVRRAMASGLSPGLEIAVVRDGRTIWEAGFGDADRERHVPVTPRTRFYIGSTSKALTALAAARLAARGQLDLDAPLSRVLPAARLAEGLSPDSITIRSLLTHTHGIGPDGPVSLRVAFTGEYTNAQLLELLASHAPAKRGRAFEYSNLGYDLVGIALAPAVTRGWKEVVEREVTIPLGMSATTAYVSRVPPDSIAQPYEQGVGGIERIRLAKQDENMGPAGGHFSTACDLARLVIAELDRGRVGGRPAIEAGVVRETQRFQVPQSRVFGPFSRYGWGLGWDLGTYDGDTLIHRFGSFPGYRSHVSFMPERRIGVVVLLNGGMSGSPLADVVAAAIYDRLLGRDDAEARLDSRLEPLVAAARSGQEAIAADRAKRAARPQQLPRPLEAYTGTFVNPLYGTLAVALEDGKLVARMGAIRSDVEVYDNQKDLLRVELFGGGRVLAVRFDGDAPQASALRVMDADFVRR